MGWGSLQSFGRGVNSMILFFFWPITKIFEKIYFCNLVCRIEKMKIACSNEFLVEIDFCLFFVYMVQILRSRLHYDVILMSYTDGWYLYTIKW